jgi:hypothetical protein
MKEYRFLVRSYFVVVVLVFILFGCKEDVAKPPWDAPSPTIATPSITSIQPTNQAGAGVNRITIQGTNFSSGATSNLVVFGKTPAEIISANANQIIVYRPNVSVDSCTVMVAPSSAYVPAKYSPYTITSVLKTYCQLPSALKLDAVGYTCLAVDASENVFIARQGTKGIFRVGTTGTIDSLLKSFNNLTDGVIGPDNRLYMFSGATQIRAIALTPGAIYASWATGSKATTRGDFDANGYLYAGGANTWFTTVSPGAGTVHTYTYDQTTYVTSTVLAVRVCSSYVYVAAKSGGSTKIFKHNVSVAGTLGAQQLVYDWSASPYGSSNITSLAFSSNGTMYVGTDAFSNPIVAVAPLLTTEYLYKDILPGSCRQLAWGNSNYLYMSCGLDTGTVAWANYRINMDTTKAGR